MIFPYLVVDLESNNMIHWSVADDAISGNDDFRSSVKFADWFQRTVLVLPGSAACVIGLGIMSIIPEYTMLGMVIYSLGWAPVASLTDALLMESLRQEGERLQINADRYGRIRMWGSVRYGGSTTDRMVGHNIAGVGIDRRWGFQCSVFTGVILCASPYDRISTDKRRCGCVVEA